MGWLYLQFSTCEKDETAALGIMSRPLVHVVWLLDSLAARAVGGEWVKVNHLHAHGDRADKCAF